MPVTTTNQPTTSASNHPEKRCTRIILDDETAALDGFKGKITRKLDNTLGLFLSTNGFQRSAVDLHSTIRPVMILMDGSDLWAVLEGRVDLLQLLLRKRRHAALKGEIFLPIHQIL